MTRAAAFMEVMRDAFVRRYPDERYSDAALARHVGIADMTVSRWRKGAIPDIDSMLHIADALDLSVLDVFTALQGREVRQSVESTDVAAAIREQTAMLERVLERLAPQGPRAVESQVEPQEAVELAEAEAESARQASAPRRRRSDRHADAGR